MHTSHFSSPLLHGRLKYDILLKLFPGVAQLVARLTGGQEAVSSSLATRTMSSVHNDTEHSVNRSNRKVAPIFVTRLSV